MSETDGSGGITPSAESEDLPEPEPAPARRTGRLLGLWLGVVALLGAGIFGIAYLAADDEGSPEEAVRRLLRAVADEDILGVLEALPPSEREPLQDELPRVAEELQRLEILSGDFELEEVSGVDLRFEDVTMQAREVGEGVSAVRFTGGTASYRVEPRELPLGDFISEFADLPAEVQSGSDTIVSDDDAGTEIVTILEDGRWYVSVYYSIAEAAREDAGAPVPEFGQGIEADGEESPEKAVEAMARAALALDVERAIALVDPEEGRALHDYAPLFIDDAKEAAASVDFSAQLTSIDLSSEPAGDGRAVVAIEKFAVDFDTADGAGSVAFDGECVSLTGPDIPEEAGRVCPEDAELPPGLGAAVSDLPTTGVVVVERGGEWYLSPTRTVLEALVGALEAVDGEDLENLSDFFIGAAESEERFSSVGEAIEASPEDLDDDGRIGGYTPQEFAELPPDEQLDAYEREFEDRRGREE